MLTYRNKIYFRGYKLFRHIPKRLAILLKWAVHCVIVGFSIGYNGEKNIYDGEKKIIANNISPYLVDAPDIFISSRTKPICDIPEMINGNRHTDGGHLLIEYDDYDDLLKQEPNAIKYVRRFMGSEEFINDKKRYCLWLLGANPVELRKMPLIIERVEKCRQSRLISAKKATQNCAETPTLFQEIRQPKTHYLAVPEVSS